MTTSIGYHRGLAHGAVRLHPWARWLLTNGGVWLTGIDPKGWVVMHRLHHRHSDTPDDPHSPTNMRSPLSMFRAQLDGYNRVLDGLRAGDAKYTAMGGDLSLSWPAMTTRILPVMSPYIAHALLALVVASQLGAWLGVALFAGLMSHVVQGAIINYLGHAYGGVNFENGDASRNNHLAAWLVLGEGFQNNHHRHPSSARFSYLRHEVDLGFGVCRALHALGVLRIVPGTLIPRPAAGLTAQPFTRP